MKKIIILMVCLWGLGNTFTLAQTTEKEKFEEKNAKILKNREAKRKEPYKIRYNKNKNAKWLILIMAICVLTGLLTPLGDTPYTYLYKALILNRKKDPKWKHAQRNGQKWRQKQQQKQHLKQ